MAALGRLAGAWLLRCFYNLYGGCLGSLLLGRGGARRLRGWGLLFNLLGAGGATDEQQGRSEEGSASGCRSCDGRDHEHFRTSCA